MAKTQNGFSVFEFVNSINDKKNPEIIDEHENDYVPFIINRSFSFFQDSIFFANAMNQYSGVLNNQQQFDFYYHVLSKRRRFSKWLKKQSEASTEEAIALIINKYDCSRKKAKDILSIFCDDEVKKKNYIETLKSEAYKGGISRK